MYSGNIGQRVLSNFIGPPGKIGTRDRDLEYMNRFLANSEEDRLPKIADMNLRDFFPGGSPLVQHLKANTSKVGYVFPSVPYISAIANKCSLDMNTVNQVEVKEITVGKCREEEADLFFEWVDRNHLEDKRNYPSTHLSLDVEEIKIPKEQYRKLKGVRQAWNQNPIPLEFPVPPFHIKDATNIPARIIIGNGITWMGSIRLNWDLTTNSKGIKCYQLKPGPLPGAFKTFLKQPYIFVGQGIINDWNGLQDFFMEIYDTECGKPTCTEMDAISLAAGWKLPKSNMFVTNLITMGGLLNKEVSCADQMWCLSWEQLPLEFKIYLIGDVRFGFCNFIVLSSLLMRNIFPDIYLLCSTIELGQPEAINWFCLLICYCLQGTNLNPSLREKATTRQELILSLRDWDNSVYPRKMMKTPNSRLVLLSELIPDWPTLVHGGPRFLHTIPPFFIKQIEVLQNLRLKHGRLNPVIKRQIDSEFIRLCTYNRGTKREDIYEGTDLPGLACKPELKDKLIDLTPDKITNQDITAKTIKTGQSRVIGILEYARLNEGFMMNLPFALQKVNLDDPEYSFWLEKTSLYAKLKSMHLLLTNVHGRTVTRLENEIVNKQNRVTRQETETRQKDEIIVENRKKREELFAVMKEKAKFESGRSVALQQEVYRLIPGDKLAKNRKKRESKKKMYRRLKQMSDYIPKREWKRMAANKQQPIRANSNTVRAANLDLRDVLHRKREMSALKKAQVLSECPKKQYSNSDSDLGESPDRCVILTSNQDTPQMDVDASPDRHISLTTYPGSYSPRGSPVRRLADYALPSTSTQRPLSPEPIPGPSCTRQNLHEFNHSSDEEIHSREAVTEDMKQKKRTVCTPRSKHSNPYPDGYETEDSSDSCDNPFITGNMMSAGFFPKKKRTGFDRYSK